MRTPHWSGHFRSQIKDLGSCKSHPTHLPGINLQWLSLSSLFYSFPTLWSSMSWMSASCFGTWLWVPFSQAWVFPFPIFTMHTQTHIPTSSRTGASLWAGSTLLTAAAYSMAILLGPSALICLYHLQKRSGLKVLSSLFSSPLPIPSPPPLLTWSAFPYSFCLGLNTSVPWARRAVSQLFSLSPASSHPISIQCWSQRLIEIYLWLSTIKPLVSIQADPWALPGLAAPHLPGPFPLLPGELPLPSFTPWFSYPGSHGSLCFCSC